jgi:hypothetical protein
MCIRRCALLDLEVCVFKLQLNGDGWIVWQVMFCSEPGERGLHLSLQQSMQRYVSNNVGDSCTTYNKKIQATYV